MKDNLKILIALFILGFILLLSISTGEINIAFNDVLLSLFSRSSDYNNQIIQNIRFPRTFTALFIGATLSASGLLTSISMKNSLADSGILGIQSGATVGALIAMLVLTGFSSLIPLFAFAGGLVAFFIIIFVTSFRNNFSPSKVVLVGVAINSVATSIIGVITILNANRIRNALSWLNGSLVSVSRSDFNVIAIYCTLLIAAVFLVIPFLKILLLDDNFILNIGHNPKMIRLLMSLLAVLLASISVAFVGIISFVGIIAPQISKKIINTSNLYRYMLMSMLIGSIIVVSSDLVSRLIFSPMEIPVGVLIGIIGAPIFVILSGGDKSATN